MQLKDDLRGQNENKRIKTIGCLSRQFFQYWTNSQGQERILYLLQQTKQKRKTDKDSQTLLWRMRLGIR